MCTEECLKQAGRAGAFSRRAALAGAAAIAASAVMAEPAQAGPKGGYGRGVRDLTHPLTTTFPAFAPGEEPSRRTYVTIEENGYYMQEWRILEHYGTHVDAPGHFIPGGRTSTELAAAELVTPAAVIDIAARAARDPDTTVTVADIKGYERRYGRIPRDAAVLMYSGWAAKAGDPDAYRGTDAGGTLHFPGFSAEATEWLLRHRRIRSLGVDTLSIDPGVSSTFDTHLILTGADRYGVENLAGLDRLPRSGATIIVGLIPYQEGSGGQARVFATW
ncbi:cyclase family protein [Phytohabitans houttuyneae]|uniref:Cyclase n=1 Tax=Phytohabitans houttuyneae TaxID=1076126 RepID=A0A6V8KRP3_9ACTN|nr:cyclase family protein [Phytohabitans houttuyneae]GFJ84467.1 cyclase [Phytohabitans houttuyneae]